MRSCLHKIINKRVLGFTLAEVLITLTVIGVVAALTIPAIIANVQKDMWVQGMKKTVSALNQATSEIMLDNGGTMAGVFANGSSISMMNTFASKMSFVKTCLPNQNPGVCFHDGTNSWHTLHGDPGWFDLTAYSRAIGSDGVLYRFSGPVANCDDSNFVINGVNSFCGWITFDVNGFKGPNTMDRDMFYVVITSKGLFMKGAIGDPNYESDWNLLCNPSAANANSGLTCGSRIMQQGGMNY